MLWDSHQERSPLWQRVLFLLHRDNKTGAAQHVRSKRSYGSHSCSNGWEQVGVPAQGTRKKRSVCFALKWSSQSLQEGQILVQLRLSHRYRCEDNVLVNVEDRDQSVELLCATTKEGRPGKHNIALIIPQVVLFINYY